MEERRTSVFLLVTSFFLVGVFSLSWFGFFARLLVYPFFPPLVFFM
jgi:hypothetical protein